MDESIAPRLHHRIRATYMTRSNERLRVSRLSALQDEFSTGKLAGRSWAMKFATHEQLVRMSRFCSNVENARSAGEVSGQAIDRHDQLSLDTINKTGLADDTDHGMAFVGGFMEGAVEFFEKVKGQT
jgi:hypothetical protein